MSLEIKIAKTPEEKEACFRLRYEVFEKHCYADEKRYPDRKIEDEYDAISTIFMAVDGDELVGTVRITPPSELGFQMESMYDLTELKENCENLWESSKVMIKEGKFGVLVGFLNVLYLFMKKNNITDLCSMTHVKNEEMYHKIGMQSFGEIKVHPGVNEPTAALLWNLEDTKEPYLSMFEQGKRYKIMF